MKMEGNAQIFVVIVNWHRLEDTLECMQSVANSSSEHLNIIVVDNGSKDGSLESIKKNGPAAEVIELPENLGFAGGSNAGIRAALAAGAQKILLLNNDATLEPEAIQILDHAELDIAVPKIMKTSQPDRIWSAGAYWRAFPPSVVIRGKDQKDAEHFTRAIPLQYATGCALLIHRNVFETLGGFDEQFESYNEDYDFCFRARRAGFSIGYCPQARVYHKVSQTLGLNSHRRWWLLGRSTVLFYRKNQRFPGWMLASFLIWVALREIAKGNLRLLPPFYSGVGAGFRQLRKQELK
jgi:GT2 family glycosyltransferase